MEKKILIPLIVCFVTLSISWSQKLQKSQIYGYWQLENGTIQESILSKDTLVFRKVLKKKIIESDSSLIFPHLKIGIVDTFPTGGFSNKFKKVFWISFIKDNNPHSFIQGKWYLKRKKRFLIFKNAIELNNPHSDWHDKTANGTVYKLLKYQIQELTQNKMILVRLISKGRKKL